VAVMNMQIDIHKPLLHIISKLINYSYYKASMVNEINRAVTHWYHDYERGKQKYSDRHRS